MEIRYAIHPEHMKSLDTGSIRNHFLVEKLFEKGDLTMVYSHIDRIITGGACPAGKKLELTVTKELGVDYFLQRREMGIINVGAAGSVWVDGKEYGLENKECLYVGMGPKAVSFASADPNHPAKFYFNSTPAHTAYPIGQAHPQGCQVPQSRHAGEGQCADHLPVHPSRGPQKLPTGDGIDHPCTGEQLEYHALSYP